MYGTHAKDGGRWERKGGKKSSTLTCSVCGERKKLGVTRGKLKDIPRLPFIDDTPAAVYSPKTMIHVMSPSELEELREENSDVKPTS